MNAPAAPKGRAIANWEGFSAEIQAREKEIASLLPQHISKERFLASAVAAVKQTPGLLEATPRSLFAAITKSAQDGILPDGREGVITIYKEKQRDNTWLPVAQWNPMTFGLRKRARELDGILVSAAVVHENDDFEWSEGDDPHIHHKPAALGSPRGDMIGVYAIFRDRAGAIVAREIMDADQVAAVRAQSKSPEKSLMWNKFTGEAWRKAVIRRGFKSVPCSESLQTIVERDDDMFAFAEDTGGRAIAAHVPARDQIQHEAAGARTFTLVNELGEVKGEFSPGEFVDEFYALASRAELDDEQRGTLYGNNIETLNTIADEGLVERADKLIDNMAQICGLRQPEAAPAQEAVGAPQ